MYETYMKKQCDFPLIVTIILFNMLRYCTMYIVYYTSPGIYNSEYWSTCTMYNLQCTYIVRYTTPGIWVPRALHINNACHMYNVRIVMSPWYK